MAKQTSEEKNEIIKKIKSAINVNETPQTEIENTLEDSPESLITDESGTQTEVIPEETQTEVSPEDVQAPENKVIETTLEKKENKSISLFSDIKNKTEEDSIPSKIEQISESFSGKDDSEISDEDLEEDSPKVRRELSEVKASAIIELADVIGMLICMGISGNWSIQSQDRFSISEKRKKSMKILIVKLLMQSKKKQNPVGSLVFLCFASIIPMIVLATMERIAKNRQKKELKQKENEIQIYKSENESLKQMIAKHQQEINAIHSQTIEVKGVNQDSEKNASEKNVTVKKSGKQGRHKKFCDYYKGLTCNCK